VPLWLPVHANPSSAKASAAAVAATRKGTWPGPIYRGPNDHRPPHSRHQRGDYGLRIIDGIASMLHIEGAAMLPVAGET
jgi:hypothetical protein